jgi:hypothetical protein
MTTPEQIDDPSEMHGHLTNSMLRFTMAYLKEHPSRISDGRRFAVDSRRVVALRDSVLYRFESLAYHAVLIDYREASCFKQFDGDIHRPDIDTIVRTASREMKFLFDDIVFSAASLFDYYARLISLLLRSGAIDNHKWPGVVRWARGSSASASQTAAKVDHLHAEWLHGLGAYRNRLIHVEHDTAGGEMTWEMVAARDELPGSESLGIRITTPAAFRDGIEYLRNTTEPPLRLVNTANWIVAQAFDGATELTEALIADIGLVKW